MTTVQLDAMNTQLWQNIGAIADSKPLMKQLAAYVAKLAREKRDSSLMTKEEFLDKLDYAEAQIDRGEGMKMMPDEDLTTFLKRNGYDV